MAFIFFFHHVLYKGTMDNEEINNMCVKNMILDELKTMQIRDIPIDRKLHCKDLRRITKYINSSIFDENKCCMWDGYVTNETNSKRGTYVNFFFRNKKVALHRLLYENFVGRLGDDSYLKFCCEENNGFGKCCNVSHMIKYKYNNITKNPNSHNENGVENNGETDANNTNVATIKKTNKTNKGKKNQQNNDTNLLTDELLIVNFD